MSCSVGEIDFLAGCHVVYMAGVQKHRVLTQMAIIPTHIWPRCGKLGNLLAEIWGGSTRGSFHGFVWPAKMWISGHQ
jgi:hypothetical protein